MTKLTKTNSGNWARESTTGGEWNKISIHVSREEAEAARVNGSQVVEITAGGKLVDRLGVQPGSIVYMVANPKKGKPIMVHASRKECESAGVKPGPMNI